MQTIRFNPLKKRNRRYKKITVSPYLAWKAVMGADNQKFNLILSTEHELMNKDDYVYNHRGELLFFYGYNPADVPVFQFTPLLNTDKIHKEHEHFGILWTPDGVVNYNMRGADCYGVPVFSHLTQDYIGSHYKNIDAFFPLTVGMVIKWYGFFLWNLRNASLQYEPVT